MHTIPLRQLALLIMLACGQVSAGAIFNDLQTTTEEPVRSAQKLAPPAMPAPPSPSLVPVQAQSKMFGAQLFGGTFRANTGAGFNPNYQISIGDRIALHLWGAFMFDGQLVGDPQGNIFIPNGGPVAVAGFAHLTPSSVTMPTWRSLSTAPPGSRCGCKPMRAD